MNLMLMWKDIISTQMKNQITTLSQTVTEADAVVLATTVEWIGMGGYMQTLS